MSKEDGYLPQSRPSTSNSLSNTIMFMMTQMLSQINVATLVEIVAVDVASRISPVGTVDVRILVQEVDGSGRPQKSDVIYEVPFFRLQGGAHAIIVDPVVGDIGFCLFCDRDISAVQASGKANPPGSKRRFNLADGFYLGGWNFGVTPSVALILDSAGCEVTAPINTTSEFQVDGVRVVTNRQPHINNPTGGTGTGVDAACRTAVNDILYLLSQHGLMAP